MKFYDIVASRINCTCLVILLILIPPTKLFAQSSCSICQDLPVVPGSCDGVYDGDPTDEDCDNNGISDFCEMNRCNRDCNCNGILDIWDIQFGSSSDLDDDGIPDECADDCNGDSISDLCEIVQGAGDCNNDGIPDLTCQLENNDCNGNLIPDDCEPDCNMNGIVDGCDITDGVSLDSNTNLVPDECECLDQIELAISTGSGELPVIVDLMVVYTELYRTTKGISFEEAEDGIRDKVRVMNLALCRSKVFVYMNLVHTEQVDHEENSTVGDDLDCLRFGTFPGVPCPIVTSSGGIAVSQLRDDKKADLVGMFVRGIHAPGSAFGQAAISFANSTGNQADAFFVIRGEAPETALAHETAHLFGCGHEIGRGSTAYAHAWTINDGGEQNLGGTLVGSYAPHVRLYSNSDPTVTYKGAITGLAFDGLVGYDNARVIRENAIHVSNYRCSLATQGTDCNGNGILDECDYVQCNGEDWCSDCNENGIIDVCDISSGTSQDCQSNDIPDDCEPDCNGNGIVDACDISNCPPVTGDASCQDCNDNGIPDSCDIAAGWADYDGNGRPDGCDDCNGNTVPDYQDIDSELSFDCNNNRIPDECPIEACSTADIAFPRDCHVNVTDLLHLLAKWGPCDICNSNGGIPCVPNTCRRDFVCAEGTFCHADINMDCTVNVFDMLDLLAAWGPCPVSCTQSSSSGASGEEICTATRSQCQLPDYQLHGSGSTPGGASDNWDDNPPGTERTIRHADDFIVTTSGAIDQVCWWGYYGDGASISDCFDPLLSTDNFTITFYAGTMHPVLNRLVPDDSNPLASYSVSPTRISSGTYVQGGQIELFSYTAALPQSFAVTANQCYWIEIKNDTRSWGATSCHWWWAWSDEGNLSSMRQHFDLGEDYLDASQTMQNADLSFCLDIDWTAPTWITYDGGSFCWIETDCSPENEADCNSNGIQDWCDINRGTSDDDDANGIPDECE